MNHPEVDTLLELARGDVPRDDRWRQHVAGCDRCAGRVDRLRRLAVAGRHIGPADEATGLVSPPPAVWDRIRTELAPGAPVVLASSSRGAVRPRKTAMVVLAAAVAGVVLGGVGGYVVRGGDEDAPTAVPSPAVRATPVAAGTLEPLGEGSVSGRMAMNRLGASRSLTITFSGDVTGPGYIEAWLLDPLSGEMLGLGIVPVRGGTVTVPLDADLSRFTTVDVSREPFDGDPAHSAESLARGVLRGA